MLSWSLQLRAWRKVDYCQIQESAVIPFTHLLTCSEQHHMITNRIVFREMAVWRSVIHLILSFITRGRRIGRIGDLVRQKTVMTNDYYCHLVRSKKPLEPAIATDWSITHSPTPRYLSIHFDTSLFSPDALSVLNLDFKVSKHVSADYFTKEG